MSELSPEKYIKVIKEQFLLNGNPTDAQQKIRYMKNHFDFYGLKAKVWVDILKTIYKEHSLLEGIELIEFIHLCFEDEYREMQYAALEMFEKVQKKSKDDYINVLEWMIIHKSWWDSVDVIAKYVGRQFEKHPNQIKTFTEKWISSNNMWLQRVTIIFQLKYKENTDEKLLFKYCAYKAHDKEFFIRKAIGWSLRQYSKTAPEAVIQFVKEHQLSALSKKEALRLLNL